ncbi:MAG: radical SAM protein [Magnetococcales bacterium]|nr:radical SAM protein [Magnetococcales bacterium]
MKGYYGRQIASAIRAFIKQHPELATRYKQAKTVVRSFRQPAFYEMATRCNLSCEGCYYFDNNPDVTTNNPCSIEEWYKFFAHEAARGVTMAYFVGAEPALEQERLLAAAPHFPFGNIGTNGTVAIDPAVPYRIGVSIWAGDNASDKELRGATVFRRALKNYRGDPRAIMLFTVTRWTIDQIETVAKMCQDHGVQLTFNLYSPTHTFLDKLTQGAENDSSYFRVSSGRHTPTLDDEALIKAHRAMGSALDRYPDTVVYSHPFNDFICGPTPLYELDPDTGVALDCGSRILSPMRYFTTDLVSQSVKCCTAEVGCDQCRLYSGGWSSKFVPRATDVKDLVSFERWLDMIETLGRIFLYPREIHKIRHIHEKEQ